MPKEYFVSLLSAGCRPGSGVNRRSSWCRFGSLSTKSCLHLLIGFFKTIIFTAIGAVIFALALPFALIAACIDSVINIASAPMIAYLLPAAFLTSPRFGPNIKIVSAILFPVSILLGLSLTAALAIPVTVLVTIGLGVLEAFSDDVGLLAAPVHCAAEAMDLAFTSPKIQGYCGALIENWLQPLFPNEEPYDIKIRKALQSIVLVLFGGIMGSIWFTVLGILCSPGAFLAILKNLLKGVSEKLKLACMLFPLVLIAIGAAPPFAAVACVTAGPIVGLISGAHALRKISQQTTVVPVSMYLWHWKEVVRKSTKTFLEFTWRAVTD